MKPNNPFLITGYHSPEYFCDRVRETAIMTDALHNERNITLIAPRRMGKTGLIKNVFYKLKEQKAEIVTLYMDIFSTQNTADFVQMFANTVLGSLDTIPQKAVSRVSKFIRSCRPVFTFDELTGTPKVTIDITPENEQITIKEIFDYLGSSERRCYIAIDEFQQINEYPEKGLEALLRSYTQFLPNVNFIFSGSKQHIMQEMFMSAKRPFYQSTQTITIDCINETEYEKFAAAFFKEQSFDMHSDTFHHIYTSFSGHTWYIQAILNRLYAYHRQPDIERVDEAISEIVDESTYTYENLLTAYPSMSIKLLKAIAKSQPVKEINSGEFIAQYKLKAASSVNTALKKLLQNELVYRTAEGYIIYDHFLAIWLRLHSF
ncbi:ATP-binding protein [Parabacteroides sp. PF5-6]|uniref:AAA family ATPase n=1 Tax=Parabacteroides sp. PF5-6 TaxID=1742403 RepID=UPI002405C6A5|nr:ATP-binding protein [Parabacteroides sp. PF5-6]MDF9830340.1 AAA+ ATPase superfamily predicted ATPase [Parabacteroides sp. PF5-6]